GHDQSLPGAQGRTPGRHRFRRTVLADSRADRGGRAEVNALLRIAGWILAVALVVLPVVAVLNGWVGAGHWPLTRLQATGEFHRVDGVLLRQTLLPYAQRGFFAVDLESAQDAVARLPWVETAEVRKRWPEVLEV